MNLKDYTTEELKAELKRRSDELKAERNKIKRCRHCKHFGEITYFGGVPTESHKIWGGSKCCNFFKTKNGKYYRAHSPYQVACEHFESKD